MQILPRNPTMSRDNIRRLGKILNAVIMTQTPLSKKDRRFLIQSCAGAQTDAMSLIGNMISSWVSSEVSRLGMRRTLLQDVVVKGQNIKWRIREKNAYVHLTTGHKVVRGSTEGMNVYPPMYYVHHNLLLNTTELSLSDEPEKILRKEIAEAKRGILVGEDSCWKMLADSVAEVNGGITLFKTLDKKLFCTIVDRIHQYGTPIGAIVLAHDVWQDFVTIFKDSPKFKMASQANTASGLLGSYNGANIYTDAYREPEIRILQPGDFYVLAVPNCNGRLSMYQSQLDYYAVDLRNQGKPEVGWFLESIQAMGFLNNHGVVKARKTQPLPAEMKG